jgi:hypothetical protein
LVVAFLFFTIGYVSSVISSPHEETGANAVLVLDQRCRERYFRPPRRFSDFVLIRRVFIT